MDIDVEVVKTIVRRVAIAELLPRFANVECTIKADRSIVTEADLIVQSQIKAQLQEVYPGIEMLSEEMTVAEQQAAIRSSQPIWCLDPIDGTSNFFVGVPYYCVSLALMKQGEALLGLVYDPNRDEYFIAEKNKGAWLNGALLNLEGSNTPLKTSIALVDFKRLSSDLAQKLVVQMPYASQRSFGSVALDWCWLASGRCHVYCHGKQNVWDYAAGHLIFSEAGGISATLTGDALSYDLTPTSAVGALSPRLFDEWLACLRSE